MRENAFGVVGSHSQTVPVLVSLLQSGSFECEGFNLEVYCGLQKKNSPLHSPGCFSIDTVQQVVALLRTNIPCSLTHLPMFQRPSPTFRLKFCCYGTTWNQWRSISLKIKTHKSKLAKINLEKDRGNKSGFLMIWENCLFGATLLRCTCWKEKQLMDDTWWKIYADPRIEERAIKCIKI